MSKAICKACGQRVAKRRGICQACFDDPSIRRQFRPVNARHGSTLPSVPGDLIVGPTDATPGSPEKIRILAARFAAGIDLHHPDDVRFERVGPGRTIADPVRGGDFGTVGHE